MSPNNVSTITFDQKQFEESFQVQEQTITYIIKLEKDDDGKFLVKCPELPGIVTSGQTEEEAIKNAYDAVRVTHEGLGITQKFQLLVL